VIQRHERGHYGRLMNTGRWVGVITLIFLAVLFLPAVAIVVVILFVGLARSNSNKITMTTAIVVMLGIFGWMNAGKEIDGDWVWYTNHYLMLQKMEFTQYWGQQIGIFRIKITEPVYYFIASVTAKMSGGSIPVIAWVVTSLIYVPLGISVGLVASKIAKNSTHVGITVLVALMIGVTFTLTTQLVRQEIATALLVLGCVLFYFEKRAMGTFFIACAIFTHNSSAVPFAVVVGVALFAVNHRCVAWERVILLWVSSIIAGLFYLQAGRGDIRTV